MSPRPLGPTFADLWAEAVTRHGERPAVRDDREVLSFREFDARQRALGAALAVRAAPDAAVGIVAAKSAWAFAAMFGAATFGRTALVLDPGEPPARWAEHCGRVGATVGFAAEPDARAALASVGLDPLGPADVGDGAGGVGPASTPGPIDPEADAWIVCTSGSTGVPKLVGIPQEMLAGAWIRNVERNARWGDPGSAMLLLPPLSSAAIRMVFCQAWSAGACVVLVDTPSTPPDRLLALVDEHDVHRLHLNPWLLRALVEAARARGRGAERISAIVSTGGALSATDIVETWRWFPRARIRSHYGSTEIAGIANLDVVPGTDLSAPDATAFVPEVGMRVRVVDEEGRDLPPGEQGEIWVASAGGYAQYRDAPDLTARFTVADADGVVWARTGDLGRMVPDGRVHVDGRDDARVKVNGIAVDLNTVTAEVRALPGVADAEVSVVPRGGDVRLVAWVVSDGTTFLTVRDLRAALARRLPATMLPHVFRAVAEIPRLPTGKADRVALRAAAAALLPVAGAAVAPRTPRERELAARFADALGVTEVGVDESFFELGGDSLGALELLTGIVAHYRVPDDRRPALESAMLAGGTVAALAAALDVERDAALDAPAARLDAPDEAVLRPDGVGLLVLGAGDPDGVPIVLLPGGGQDPLSFRPLLRRLDGHRVWTLTPRGFRSRVPADRSIEEMAGRFADALLDRDPRGAFVVAGFSFGGLVAVQLGADLVARGAPVPLVAVLDAPVPGSRAGRLPEVVPGERPPPASRAPVWVRIPRGAAFRVRWAWLGRTAGRVARTGWVQGEAFLSRATRLVRRWHPPRYPGRVLVVRSAHSAAEGWPPDLGWSTVLAGPVETLDVPGDHFAVLLEPSVTRIGEVLAEAAVG